jgi:tRNA A22 N-methylase
MTTTTTKKFNTFLSRPLQDCTLNDIPGVGPSSLSKLLSSGMDTPEKLMGLYLISNSNPKNMKQWLMDKCKIRTQEAGKISDAVDKKSHGVMLVC